MIILEVILMTLLLGMLGAGYKTFVKERFSSYALFFYFFIILFVSRHLMLMTGLDVPFPEYLFNFEFGYYRLIALTMVTLWLVVFLFTCHSNTRLSNLASKALPQVSEQFDLKLLAIPTLALFLISFAVILYPIRLYGLDFGAISYALRIEKIFSGISIVQFLGPISSYLLVAWVFTYIKQHREAGTTPHKFVITSMIICSALSTLTTLVMGERDQFAFYILFVAINYSLFCKRLSTFFLSFLASIIVAYMVVAGWIRLYMWGYTQDSMNIFRKVSSGLNLDVYDKFILLLSAWRDKELRNGEDIWLGIIGIIPRSLWAGKPAEVHPGVWLRQYFEPEIPSGWPFTPVGEWYINFGWFGIVAGAAFSGVIYGAIARRYHNYETHPFSFMLMYLMATRIFLLGYNTVSPMNFVLWIIPIAMVFWFERFFRTRK